MSFNGTWFRIFSIAALITILTYSILVRRDAFFAERLWPDEALYAWLAEVVSQDFSSIFRPILWYPHPPLFPLLLAPVVKGGSLVLEKLHLVAIVIDLTTLAVLYIFTLRYFSRLVALVALFVVASNNNFNFLGGYILMDNLFALLHIPFIVALLRVKSRESWGIDDLMVGVMGVIISLLKYYGGLFLIPWVTCYYLYSLNQLPIGLRLKRAFLPVGIIGIVFIPFLINTIIPALTVGMPKDPVFTQSAGYYFQSLPMYVGGLFIFFLFVLGVLFLIKENNPLRRVIFLGIAIELIALSACSIKDIRYLVPVLLLMAICIGVAVERLFALLGRRPVLRTILSFVMGGFFAAVLFGNYYTLRAYRYAINLSYSGFKEAGLFVRTHSKPGALILAGGIYQIRFWSKVELNEYGGRVYSIPRTVEHMNAFLKLNKGPVWLVVDAWQYIQPQWIHPLTNDKIMLLENMGFKLRSYVLSSYQNQSAIVACVFERPAIK